MGIQWHPEAYYGKKITKEDKRHLNIIRYMVDAGDAYKAKRTMLKQFRETYSPSDTLTSQGIFKKRKKIVKNKTAANANTPKIKR